jgi:hypothetical protein
VIVATPAYLSRRDPPQKRLPDQQRHFFGPPLKAPQPHGQKTFASGARNAQANRAEASHEIALVIAVAVVPPLPPPTLVRRPTRKAVALPLRLQFEKSLPRMPRLSVQIAPETLFQLGQKMLEMLVDRDYLRHRV